LASGEGFVALAEVLDRATASSRKNGVGSGNS
jgi:hypothetical protein